MGTIQRFGPFQLNEETTLRIHTPSGEFIADEHGDAIPGFLMNAVTLTLYDKHSGTIIRGPEQDILNANDGEWDSGGNFALLLAPEDNAILNDARAHETHVALIEYEYPTGEGKMEAVLNVRNLVKVPA